MTPHWRANGMTDVDGEHYACPNPLCREVVAAPAHLIPDRFVEVTCSQCGALVEVMRLVVVRHLARPLPEGQEV